MGRDLRAASYHYFPRLPEGSWDESNLTLPMIINITRLKKFTAHGAANNILQIFLMTYFLFICKQSLKSSHS